MALSYLDYCRAWRGEWVGDCQKERGDYYFFSTIGCLLIKRREGGQFVGLGSLKIVLWVTVFEEHP